MSIGKKLMLTILVITFAVGSVFAQKTYHIGVTLYDRDQFISSLEQAILEAAKKYQMWSWILRMRSKM